MANQLNILEIQEIMALLPHRYPFLMIDRVLDFTPGESLTAIKNVTINEPIFTGHFPTMPIFPGVLILEALAQATGILGFKTVTERAENELYLLDQLGRASDTNERHGEMKVQVSPFGANAYSITTFLGSYLIQYTKQ